MLCIICEVDDENQLKKLGVFVRKLAVKTEKSVCCFSS